MKYIAFSIIIVIASGCNNQMVNNAIIATGQMPSITRDNNKTLHLAYATGDSVMYSFSSVQGRTFSTPSLISVVPNQAASHTRGPQIAVTYTGLVLTACNNSGNIFSFVKEAQGVWTASARVNDLDTVAKENLMSLGADGQNAFPVWLDLRDSPNKISGSWSKGARKTWNKNTLIINSVLAYLSLQKILCRF